ncbi:3-oxoacyl-ACP synthase III family protein [Nostocaceae cyanobacterium CENA357]|uniref:3-oxoacyl-ACP synthase III family protein n=1 Tax=Atlanticothrix silvestris CENA357 TaxID=1725252 RepID=A0A8J7HH68_9CYAN|nr:3-oxoacyl-ACP synthase III family protein [Atlanticothrix silvestris]MBH8552288.1 3-oxoacyl-ACP synthase III family protein [Atlanticothrix silvestris CENA357]
MIYPPVGIRSIAVNFPRVIRTNDYWRENYPDVVATAEQKSLSKVFSPADATPSNEFELEMAPYLKDPFRGTVERRILSPDESSLTLEYGAAKDAIAATQMSPEDIDLMIVASLWPENILPGNAAFLANQLGLRGAAWNLDSTCSNAMVALQNATALVRTGEYRNVLVVVSCTYSRFTDENDTLSWFFGDGAGAFVVAPLRSNQGILSTKIVNTSATCGTFYNELTTNAEGKPRMLIRAAKNTNRVLSETAVDYLRECCLGAMVAAGVTLNEIKFFAFNTPTAWYSRLCIEALGIDPERTINLYPHYANIGPMLPIANLYHGAQLGKIHENDLVLVYTIGSVSNAAATVMRWGNVALGSAPVTSTNLTVDTELRSKIVTQGSDR